MNTLSGYSKSTLSDLYALTASGGHFPIHSGRNNEANKLVRTDANGYLNAGWINTTSGAFTGTPSRIYASNDAYIRYMTPANFFPTLTNTSNLLDITIGGLNRKLTVAYATNAGSATNADTVDNLHSYAFKKTWDAHAGKTYIGWVTIAKWTMSAASHFSPKPFMLSIHRAYNSPASESYTFAITFGWDTAHITQVSGNAKNRIIEKLRIAKCSDNLTYRLEMYVNTSYTTYDNGCMCVAYGYYDSNFSATTVCELTANVASTLAEVTTASNYIVGNLSGNATSATQVIVNLHTANNTEYPLVWSNSASTSTTTGNLLYKSYSHLTYNPSAHRISTGLYIANNSSGPHFTANSTAGNWAYLRLHNGSTYWDIATRSTSGSGGLWLARLSGADNGIFVSTGNNVGISTSSPSYKLHVAGDAYATGWSRAGSGFYVEGKGVHYMSNNVNGLGLIYLTSNEFNWSASGAALYFNYRASANGTTVTLYIWNAGSSSTYASHTLGALTSRSDLTLYGLTQTCNKANDANYMNSALQIREYNFGGAQTDTWAIAPRLSWHWSGRVQTQIGLNSSGDLKLSKDLFATSYLLLHLGNSSVSGGGSSGGSSITVNIGNNSKTLTIPTSLPANGGTSSYTNYLKIHDVRGTNHLPNSTTYPEKNITAWFNSTGTPDGNWWSGITVKGWTSDYSAWLLCSYSSTGTANNYGLYVRNGISSGWGSWRVLLDSGNSSISDYNVKINGTTKQFVRDWGHGAANMNAVARRGRSSMGMADLSTPSGGTATAVNPNGGTSWHHFINISYTDGGAGSNSWVTLIANKAGTTDLWVRSRSGGTISDTAAWTAGWTRILTGSNYTNITDGRYIKKSGDTMTGALNFANGTWNVVGDDSAMGDCNKAGLLGIKSLNNNLPGIAFFNSSGTQIGSLYSEASVPKWSGNTMWHEGNDGSGSGLDADLLDGTHKTGLLTALSSSSSTNLSITVGGTTKSVTDAYAKFGVGTYTSGGGEQRPSYIGSGLVRWNMMRATTTYFNSAPYSGYCDWMMMDTYTGSDVPYVTMIGVLKAATPHAYIASGSKGDSSGKWNILTLLDSNNSSVADGGSTWGSKLTVKINGTTKTLTIPANPNTWRGITDSYSGTDSTISLSQKGGNALYNALVNGYASSAGNADTVDNLHASDFVRAYSTYGTSYSYDSDWGLSIVTFDPIVSGTAPAQNPNITILNLGNNYSRRKQLAFTYSTNDIYYRRRTNSWSGWVRLAIAGESYTKGDSDGRYYPISGNVNMSGDNKWIGSTMGGGTDYWRIGGTGTGDTGVCLITIGDNSNDYFQIVIADYSGTNYTALLVKNGGTYAPHFYESSDQRLKENIKAILNKDNIPQIKEFDWKESGEHSYGLIAQELEELGYSELVSTKDDGYKTVNYSAALSLIVGKLQVKIRELEKEIEILKNKN